MSARRNTEGKSLRDEANVIFAIFNAARAKFQSELTADSDLHYEFTDPNYTKYLDYKELSEKYFDLFKEIDEGPDYDQEKTIDKIVSYLNSAELKAVNYTFDFGLPLSNNGSMAEEESDHEEDVIENNISSAVDILGAPKVFSIVFDLATDSEKAEISQRIFGLQSSDGPKLLAASTPAKKGRGRPAKPREELIAQWLEKYHAAVKEFSQAPSDEIPEISRRLKIATDCLRRAGYDTSQLEAQDQKRAAWAASRANGPDRGQKPHRSPK